MSAVLACSDGTLRACNFWRRGSVPEELDELAEFAQFVCGSMLESALDFPHLALKGAASDVPLQERCTFLASSLSSAI